MKVFLSSDMEGTTGVVDWNQCLVGEPGYDYYRGLLQGEVNAAIEGAQSAGADEFQVNDSHSKMQNLRPDTLAGKARYLSGRHKPLYMMQGLDSSFDAIFFVSYHGSMSSPAPLSHTCTVSHCSSRAAVIRTSPSARPARPCSTAFVTSSVSASASGVA